MDENMNKSGGRPVFPKRAVVTAGMPYGNKELHIGHIAVFTHSDVFARFLRDRIGKDNVIYVSGTDCYGSPIMEYYRQKAASGEFVGSIGEFVQQNHNVQKDALDAYHFGLNLFAASGLGRPAEIHKEMCAAFFTELHNNGHLVQMRTPQFYDPELGVFLNGRQVVGRCPIAGCQSEKGYADECDLGHQYMPSDLIAPKSTLTGKTPEFREIANWYIKLPAFQKLLEEWVARVREIPGCRLFVANSIAEFLDKPTIHIKHELLEQLDAVAARLPEHTRAEGQAKSYRLVFKNLEDREAACRLLTGNGIRYRTGKTLVPFRLTGNIEWGVPAPVIEGLGGLTFWVWPESLWAPVSFTAACLEQQGKDRNGWKDWWSSKDARVYQFLGEDNVYFYGPAEMAMFMGSQGKNPVSDPPDGQLQLPELVVHNHIMIAGKKAASSGAVKPPTAFELLDHYTADQLRTHIFRLGIGLRAVDFKPKPFNPNANPKDADPVLKEGNLLCNVFNRAARSCFYTAQKHCDGKIPVGNVSPEVLAEANKAILEFELTMHRHEFHQSVTVADNYIREINKYFDKNMKAAGPVYDDAVRQTLIDTFHMIRVATVLMHPIAPVGTEMIREYLEVGEEFWSWDRIFDPVYAFMKDPENHRLKFLESRIDFFKKHPSQIGE